MPRQILHMDKHGEVVSDIDFKAASEEILAKIGEVNKKNAHIAKTAIDAETPRGETGNLAGGNEAKESKFEKTDWIIENKQPHAALVALGTGVRSTKSGANRGTMPPNNFFQRGAEKVKGEMIKNFEGVLGDD